MPEHTEIGTVACKVGHFKKGEQERKRYRNIGTLMQTRHSTGEVRYWLKLNADILHASMFSLVRQECMERGDDSFVCNIFEPRKEPAGAAAQSQPPPAGMDDDEIPF